jgi:ABC-2 type transport system permease protein
VLVAAARVAAHVHHVQDVLPYLPSNAGAGVFAVHPDSGMLGTWAGYAVFCAWAAAALLLGLVVLRRRDR